MRELKREEYGMISGGIHTTSLPPVHVVAIDPSSMTNLGSLAMGNGSGGAAPSGGGSVTVTYAKGQITSATLQCATGSNPSIGTGAGNVSASGKLVARLLGASVGAGGSGSSIHCVKP